MESKEETVLELFFEEPTREWHFEEILKDAKISRSKASIWLRRFMRERLVRRVKEKGKMPHYIGDYESPSYKNRKRLFAMNKLYESGLLDELISLEKARTAIIFGSLTRSDWNKDSDVDLFVYGDTQGLRTAKYEARLGRDIQVFACSNPAELKRLGPGLISNILKGQLIKGDLGFVKVDVNA